MTPIRQKVISAAVAGMALAALASGGAQAAATAPVTAGSGFWPLSVTFPSTSAGWALGSVTCAATGRCLALRKTTDGGHSWSVSVLPTALVKGVAGADANGFTGLGVRFADTRNGWIFGGDAVKLGGGDSSEPALWSTHDGGKHWTERHTSGIAYSILDLEAANGMAHLVAQNKTYGATIESSPVGADHWHVSTSLKLGLPAGGSDLEAAIVLTGTHGWLIEGNDRGTTGSARLAGGRWVAWTPPCASVGGGFSAPAAASATELVASCVMGGYASPLSKSAPRGAKVGSTWLYVSSNGGESFKAGPELARKLDTFETVLASPAPGTILVDEVAGGAENLKASFDTGRHWQVVDKVDVATVDFASATEGFGIVDSTRGGTTMIATSDGGRHWHPVAF